MKRNKILVVDDSEINRSLLSDMLSDDYEILEAVNGLEAVASINRYQSEISLILLDIVMPQMDGFELLTVMNNNGYISSIPVIIISAENASLFVDQAYDLGAVDYINRPFDEKTIKRRVKNTIMLYSKQKMLEDMVTEQMMEKEKSNLIMVEILSHIVEFRNGESGLHVLHIRAITEALLKRLVKITDKYNLTSSMISLIAYASAMHDIGKITIPESILNKPSKLTPEEYEIIKTHSASGAKMLESVSYYQSEELIQFARDICRWHHERYDGAGYPDGLVGENIPIAAQVVSLADVYDALTNKRVYKPAYSHPTALNMILNGECGTFNPLLLRCLEDASPYFEKGLYLHTASITSRNEIQDAVRNLMNNGIVSNRTLSLFEMERTKYLFFASMSNEIQFEYDAKSDLLTISDWGANCLGLPCIIVHPESNDELNLVFNPKDYKDFKQKLHSVSPENPVVTQIYSLDVKGEQRYYKAVARPLWIGDASNTHTGVIGKFVDIHEEHMELKQLRKMAQHDSLTGLYNREYSCKLISRILRHRLAEEKNYALLLIDLDYFKTINDSYGHMFGDKVLEKTAVKLHESTRNTDVIARVGGDEFLILLEYKDDVDPLINNIYESMSEINQLYGISISMGIALSPKDGDDYNTLFHRSDQALYEAKNNGRNQHCYYNQSMKELLSVLSPVESEENS